MVNKYSPNSISEKIGDDIRRLIMAGDFLPGMHLTDRMVCERFKVSRSIVREVMRRLKGEGLVEIIPNRGTFVIDITINEAVQLYEIRSVLESFVVSRFTERSSDEEKVQLRVAYDFFAKSDYESKEEIFLRKQDFYEALFKGCRNGYVVKMLKQIMIPISLLRSTSLSQMGRLEKSIQEIGEIVEAIDNRDSDFAAQKARTHVDSACLIALDVLRSRGSVGIIVNE
ncbi:MAG: GntR family transcriptional regulator [Ostreibacterium sp.]